MIRGSYSNYYKSSMLLQGSLMNVMGTRLDVLFICQSQLKSMQVWTAIEAEVKRLDKMLNKFDPESDLAKINQQANATPVNVNDERWKILKECQRYHQLTYGYFDISLIDFNDVWLDEKNTTVFYKNDTIQLDLSGYAKGYALEKIRDILVMHHVSQAFINFGNSSILALGNHPHGKNWVVGITDPYSGEMIGKMELKDNAMSTSGNMPNHQKHIINPHNGLYCEDRRIVCIASANAIEAEVLSTALMVADERTSQIIKKNFTIVNQKDYFLNPDKS